MPGKSIPGLIPRQVDNRSQLNAVGNRGYHGNMTCKCIQIHP